MSVLELAQALGNITQACRRTGISTTQFYQWKKRFHTHGMEGLKHLQPIPKNHPFTTPVKTLEKIKQLALLHPETFAQ